MPAEAPSGAFGPRLEAEVSYLTGRLPLSHREAPEDLAVCREVEIALGSVAAIQQQGAAG